MRRELMRWIMFSIIGRFLRDESGMTATDYGLISAGVAAGAVIGMGTVVLIAVQ